MPFQSDTVMTLISEVAEETVDYSSLNTFLLKFMGQSHSQNRSAAGV